MIGLPAAVLLALTVQQPLAPTGWNDSAVLALVHRAILRRAGAQADTGLRDFSATAHGFVFFLGQLGEQLTDPPRLIKTDQLVLQVYWKAPGKIKQRIVGWRDRLDLPSDIQYHRDHLGIVMGGFGDRIQLGEGTEVRGVPHPLSPMGPALYDYALTDSLLLQLPNRTVRVYEVSVRPRDLTAPRIVGRMYLDVDYADLVRFSFQFTPSAYLDRTLEDITVVLDNALWEGRFWLPRRQEIEIRRRSDLLDLPARGIIRGRWEIGGYRFNLGLEDSLFRGPEIVAAPREVREEFVWPEVMDEAIARQMGAPRADLREVQDAVSKIVERRLSQKLPALQPGAPSISEIIRVNRVEGLALGGGFTLRPGLLTVRTRLSYGTSDRRAKGGIEFSLPARWGVVALSAGREVRDAGEEPRIAPLLNSLLAQEAGLDYGDYFLLDQVELAARYSGVRRPQVALSFGLEQARSLEVKATPVRGSYRSNPPLGGERYAVTRLELDAQGWPLASGQVWVAAEGGLGPRTGYLRLAGKWSRNVRPGIGELAIEGSGVWASSELPVHRAFLWGGRGAVRCDQLWGRCGGRYGLIALVEWRLRAPFAAVRLSPVISTGREVTLAPFLRAGWLGGSMAGSPWSGTGGVIPVGGLAVEWFHQLLRFEVGVAFNTGAAGVTVDINRALWSIL